MGASATATPATGKQSAVAKIASAIEACPQAKAAYNAKYWPNPKEPLAENVMKQLGTKAPFSLGIEGLDGVKKDGRLTFILEMFPPDYADDLFGRETLMWMWKEYHSRDSRNKITEYLKFQGTDIKLLERAECAASTRALLVLYEMLQNAWQPISRLDVRRLVEDSAIANTGKRHEQYEISFMETELVKGCGWEKNWGMDTAYRIHLDAPIGIGLLYKSMPNAVSSAIPLDGQTLLVKQLQSLRPFDPKNILQRKGGSRGLFGLDWQKLLVEANEQMARFFGFSVLAVQSAANNEWVIMEDRNQTPHLKYESAVKIYDETANRLGFVQGKNGNFYRKINTSKKLCQIAQEKIV
ncbi:MAG: hypothetical protein NTV88_05695 [Candidatus Micrarchaeota archaeon]|nr:hypothetical protein [Candidatus Micrarchaeota archaeon]